SCCTRMPPIPTDRGGAICQTHARRIPDRVFRRNPLRPAPHPGYQPGMTTPPTPRGTLTPNRPLSDLTWLRVGGPADWLFQPADEDDLAGFLRDLPPEIPVFPMGVGSNLIVRDGGIRAVVIRLGRGFNGISVEGETVTA